jgi:DNA repair photolyase
MRVDVTETTVKNILTRTTGYLRSVTTHSLQPYRGCTFGNSLCGVGCYVQHNGHLLRGRRWGGFLEVRTNAASSYREHYERELSWARRHTGWSASTAGSLFRETGPNEPAATGPRGFSIFCSSATDPFLPQEFNYGITRSVLEAMPELPPDELVLQTHTHLVTRYGKLCVELSRLCRLRVHVSIETDRERLPGLPPPASSVELRLAACAELKQAGLNVVVTVSPLLPIAAPDRFFERIAEVADAVVIDHFIQGDGSADGHRTLRTQLPQAMRAIDPASVALEYRDEMAGVAQRYLPGRVGVSVDGFAQRYLPAPVPHAKVLSPADTAAPFQLK